MTEPSQLPHNTRVLVADDDESFRDWIVTFLTRQGVLCEQASTSKEASQQLNKHAFDAVIVDIRMEGNERLQLAQTVVKSAPGIPLILVTGYPSIESAVKAIELPVAAYLVKPFETEQLLSILSTCVLRYRMLKSLVLARERLEQYKSDLQIVEQDLRSPLQSASGEPLENHLHTILRSLLPSNEDLSAFLQTISPSMSNEPRADEALGSEDAQQTRLLQDTVKALKRTQHLFKSRELGRLRKRLESFLDASGNPVSCIKDNPETAEPSES